MASLARRLAPAAALGGLAVVIVGIADPAIANLTRDTEIADAPQPLMLAQGQQQGQQQGQEQGQQQGQEQGRQQGQKDSVEPTATCANAEQVAGDAVMTQWGPVQVVAAIDGTSLCAVQAVEWPQNDSKSQMINSYAIPELDAMASDVGTQFDYISGATYTSEAYRDSLQSILDRM